MFGEFKTFNKYQAQVEQDIQEYLNGNVETYEKEEIEKYSQKLNDQQKQDLQTMTNAVRKSLFKIKPSEFYGKTGKGEMWRQIIENSIAVQMHSAKIGVPLAPSKASSKKIEEDIVKAAQNPNEHKRRVISPAAQAALDLKTILQRESELQRSMKSGNKIKEIGKRAIEKTTGKKLLGDRTLIVPKDIAEKQLKMVQMRRAQLEKEILESHGSEYEKMITEFMTVS